MWRLSKYVDKYDIIHVYLFKIKLKLMLLKFNKTFLFSSK